MIVQACLNGSRPNDFHGQLPLTAEALASDGASCIAAGAAELHIHPRGLHGRESLAAIDLVVPVVRRACPGTPVGVSTGAWIERDETQTINAINGWNELPDYASVNLAELDAPAVMELLRRRGVGIEAGIASVADAERFLSLPDHHRVLRIMIEMVEQNFPAALKTADDIAALFDRAGMQRPILLHGLDATVWPFVTIARQRRWSTRIGFEDGKHLPDGTVASGNAALVAAAVAMYRGSIYED
jgi:uncharacterized protein (DUF849 family)